MVVGGPLGKPIFDPEKGLKILGRIIEFGKKVIDYLVGGDDVKDQSAMDTKNSSAEDTMNLNSILLEYRNKVKEDTKPVESNVKDVCKEVFASICDSVDFANSQFQIYKVESVKRKLDNIIEDIDGIFEKHVIKRISLDDERCVDILKMLPGDLKGQRMSELKKEVFKEAIEDICTKLEKFQQDIFDNMEISIESRMEGIESKLLEKTEMFEEISQNSDERNKKIESITIKANYILDLIYLSENC